MLRSTCYVRFEANTSLNYDNAPVPSDRKSYRRGWKLEQNRPNSDDDSESVTAAVLRSSDTGYNVDDDGDDDDATPTADRYDAGNEAADHADRNDARHE